MTSSSAKKIVAWRECLFRYGLEGEDAHAPRKQVKTRHRPPRPRDPGNARPLAEEEEQDSQIRKAHVIRHHPYKVYRVPCHADPEGEQKYSSAFSSTSALDCGGPRPLDPRKRDTIPILRRLGSPRGRCRRVHPTGVISSDPLVHTKSLYRLCYEGRLSSWGWAYVLQKDRTSSHPLVSITITNQSSFLLF